MKAAPRPWHRMHNTGSPRFSWSRGSTWRQFHEYQKVKELYPRSDVVDDAQFGIATVQFLQEDYAQARSQFKVVADNPRSDLSDPARFRIGECFRLQREFNSAILNYKKVSRNQSMLTMRSTVSPQAPFSCEIMPRQFAR